jgi:glycerol-3-phosphate O-acyltransferase
MKPIKQGFATRLKARFRTWIDRALGGTHEHFFNYLPIKKGKTSTWLLKLFFSGIKDNDDQLAIIRHIPDDATIVYLNKYKSKFDFLFYHTRYPANHLPAPEIGLGYRFFFLQPITRSLRIFLSAADSFLLHFKQPDPYHDGYFSRVLMNGKCAFMSLVEKKGFYRRFVKAQIDPIGFLIKHQKSTDKPLYIVPQLMAFGKKPKRSVPSVTDLLFGSQARPGLFRRLVILFKTPEKMFYEVSTPVNLQLFLNSPENRDLSEEQQTLMLRRNLLLQINRHRQSITGPMRKSIEEVKENILTNQRLKGYMDLHAEKRNLPLWKVRKKADAYLDEIAAKQNAGLLRFAEVTVGWILNTMFQGVSYNEDGLNRVKTMAQKGPLVFVPCHKSHVDYLMLPYLMYIKNMPVPLIAAGKNMFFWPMGPVFRALGAFSLRRTFKGNVLYAKVFGEYIHKLLEEGFNLKVFIEGTRSRTGKLIMPKLGFISILLNAYKNKACEDLVFAPVYIGYDRVLEEKSYLHEVEGGKKEDENFLQVLNARKFLKNRYGKIYIKFNDPISLNTILAQDNLTLSEMSQKDQNALCRNLGHRIINAINTVTVVTPQGLLASALLNSTKKVLSYKQLMADTTMYLNHLNMQKVNISDTLVMNHVHAMDNALESYVARKLVERISDGRTALLEACHFKVNMDKRPILEFYKNNCIAFFIPAAFTALIILDKDAFQFSASDLHADYAFLQDFFKYEFAFDIDLTPGYYVRKTIKSFIDDAIIIPHPTLPETYNITSAGFRKLKLHARFLKTYFESYWIVLNYFQTHKRDDTSAKERLKIIHKNGNRMYKAKTVERIESISKVYFQNGVNFFTTHGIKGAEDEENIVYYNDVIQRYLERIHP